MAITCCLCGKKQSGWICDYPFSVELSDQRVCAECYDRYEKIVQAKALSDVQDEIAYIKNVTNNNSSLSTTINLCLNKIFEVDNSSKSYNEVETEMTEARKQEIDNMLVTSGFDVQGYDIIKYHDYISSEVVMGMGAIKAIFASISNITGMESDSLSEKIGEARKKVLEGIREKALEKNANAIIGLDIDFTMFGDSLIAVIANGTAVTIKKKE